MSSSGLIYAIIVGAWAAYLVPMWLRREDELNRARQTQRYSTAIKVLANKESFERRLPIAAGQNTYARAAFASNGLSTSGPGRAETAKSASGARPKTAPATARKVGARPIPAGSPASAVKKAAAAKKAVTSKTGASTTGTAKKTVAAAPAGRRVVTARIPEASGAPKSSAQEASTRRRRVNVINRRRRVVSALFMLTTLGTLVTADLGPAFLWTMAVPAVTLSAYIVWLRRDERTRATARVGRRAAAASQAKLAATAARNAEKVRLERQRLEKHRADRLRAAQASTEEQRRAQSARRRNAAARARADRYAAGAADPELRKAANS
jgi:hypothetical protein